MRGQRGTLRALFLDQGNRFSRRQHKVQPWSEVVSEKKIFNDNGGLVVRFVGTQEISACRVRNDHSTRSIFLFLVPELTMVGRLLQNSQNIYKYIHIQQNVIVFKASFYI